MIVCILCVLFYLGAFSYIMFALVCVAWICSQHQPLEVFSFVSTPHTLSMKFAAIALLVAGASSTSVSSHEQSLLKHLSFDTTLGEMVTTLNTLKEHQALLARGQPQQSFLQNDLEGVTKGEQR